MTDCDTIQQYVLKITWMVNGFQGIQKNVIEKFDNKSMEFWKTP